jgi:hypothetical protein
MGESDARAELDRNTFPSSRLLASSDRGWMQPFLATAGLRQKKALVVYGNMDSRREQLQATDSNEATPDRIERVPFGERWMTDVWETFRVPGGFGLLLVDMTQVKKALRILRDGKIPATLPHLVVRAAGMGFAHWRDQRLAVLVNYERLYPGHLNVGLSMAGETSYAPVVVVPAVDQKPLSTLIPTIIERVDTAAAREARDLKALYQWAIPFRWLRLWILRSLSRSMKWRVAAAGHFQVTCLSNVDVVVPLSFYANGIVGVGAMRDRVIAVDGVPVVRPTAWLSGVADHAASDGMRGGQALYAMKAILESEELVREAREAVALKAAQAKESEPSKLLREPQPVSSSQDGQA